MSTEIWIGVAIVLFAWACVSTTLAVLFGYILMDELKRRDEEREVRVHQDQALRLVQEES